MSFDTHNIEDNRTSIGENDMDLEIGFRGKRRSQSDGSDLQAFLAGDGMKRRLVTGSKIRVRSTPLQEWYSRLIKQEYHRLKSGGDNGASPGGLAEVKLRLFLSLLDNPVVDQSKLVANAK